ncbi:MAG: hypothetical protein PHY90_08690 [Desulfitobacteriaceae bacterium]|nr:hypothetical protein [Desulfitobacteriaceae bacterium]
MEYSTLVIEMFNEIPEFKRIYEEKSSEYLVDDSTGAHAVVGTLFMPYVFELLSTNQNKNNLELLERIFIFFERMAQCEDEKVKEVLLYTVLEMLGDDEEVYQNSITLMKTSTKQMSKAINTFLGRD